MNSTSILALDFLTNHSYVAASVFCRESQIVFRTRLHQTSIQINCIAKAIAQRAVCCLGGSFRIYFGCPYSGVVKAIGSPALRHIIQLSVTRIRGRTPSSFENQSVYRVGAAKGCQSSASSLGPLVHSFWQSRLQVLKKRIRSVHRISVLLPA